MTVDGAVPALDRGPSGMNVEGKALRSLRSAGTAGFDWDLLVTRLRSWKPYAAVILGFWGIWYVFYTAYGFINSTREAPALILPRLFIAIAGIVLSFGVALILERQKSRPLALRASTALVLAVMATIIHSFFSDWVWALAFPDDRMTSPFFVAFASNFIVRFWFFASASAVILALSYGVDIRERERQIAILQGLAHSAQLRALRNQLNPHFLFNALNSVAALLSRGDAREAEAMTENLADFLRATLALDPQQLVRLDEEISLQNLYLAVEKVRFPERLSVVVDMADDARSLLVPALITQPLVENSIKYAVARSTAPVVLRIAARRLEGVLELVVENDGGNAEPAPSIGERVGLLNVQERLAAHFGEAASFESGRTGSRGFRNLLRLPATEG
ncbi:MAG TPA: histidine kinase [Sphingomicrobium sp.]|nr:histidine kinase [Sphingomicrobium sp.]